MKRVVVTGALGHIGSKLIHSFSPDYVKHVDLIDDLSTQRYVSLFNLPQDIKFRFFEEDICQADLNQFFQGADVVIHLAAITNAEGSLKIRDQVERTNFEATERVAEACIECGCKMVFLSTTSVYGKKNGVVDEDCPIEALNPQSPYAESKLRAEQMLLAKGESSGLQFVICRFGTIFGVSKGMRFHTAINKFIWLAATGRPITVWRTAMDQCRPYLDLDDAVRALHFILEKEIFDGRIYNVVTTNTTVRDIVEIIKRHIPEVETSYVDSPIMNQLSYTVTNDRFQAQGFTYKGSLETSIVETIDLLKNLRD